VVVGFPDMYEHQSDGTIVAKSQAQPDRNHAALLKEESLGQSTHICITA